MITERFFVLLEADPQGVTLFNIYRYGLVVLDESPLLKAIYTRDRRVLGDYVRRMRDTSAYAQAMDLSVEFVRHFQQAGLMRRDLDPEAVTYLLSALRYGVLTMERFHAGRAAAAFGCPDGRRTGGDAGERACAPRR